MKTLPQILVAVALILAILFLAHIGSVITLAIAICLICSAMILEWYGFRRASG